jgi:hypothetical protein
MRRGVVLEYSMKARRVRVWVHLVDLHHHMMAFSGIYPSAHGQDLVYCTTQQLLDNVQNLCQHQV